MASELHAVEAEGSIVGTLLSQPTRIPEVISDLTPEAFSGPTLRALYEAIRSAYYADRPIDPLTIAAAASVSAGPIKRLADEHSLSASPLREHAALIRRCYDRRELIRMANAIVREAEKDEIDPSAISARISRRALEIATRTVAASEIVSFADAGRQFINTLNMEIEATRQGIDLGALTGIASFDQFTRGMRPGRLYMIAGEPGVGKSAIGWMAALSHAKHQASKPESRRIATLILSMEMGAQDSSARFAQRLGQVEGQSIQDGMLSAEEVQRILHGWNEVKDIPLYLNYSPNLRASEMLALVAEAVRRHNVGLVIIDHFRTFDLDKRLSDSVQEDEEKARFLTEQIARGLNVAVLCMAHTRKPSTERNHGRPHMADLRGSGQISAYLHGLCFVYRPIMYATEEEITDGDVLDTDAELIWRKNRQGPTGTGKVFFDPAKMNIH